jgi:hypothetical protein
MPGIGLLLETERCLDGVHLVDGFFRPRSERREPVRVVSADLNSLVVLDFVNARDELAPFLARYSTGTLVQLDRDPHAHIDPPLRERLVLPKHIPSKVEPFAEIKMVTFWQEGLRRNLVGAGGPDPVNTLVSLSHPAIDLGASFNLRDGKPQMLLRCEHLLDFMKMEVAMIALEGAKLVTCEHCKNFFLTGPSTSRRIHATHCSDRCRVAAMRARKKESQ